MNDKHAEMAKRFRLAAEILESGATHYECYDHLRGWERLPVGRAALADDVRYGREFRAIEPAPEPEWVELEPGDVFPCSAFRHPNWGPGIHITPSLVYRDGVSWTGCASGTGATPEIVTFRELMDDGWQINRSIPLSGKWDPLAWETCSKRKA